MARYPQAYKRKSSASTRYAKKRRYNRTQLAASTFDNVISFKPNAHPPPVPANGYFSVYITRSAIFTLAPTPSPDTVSISTTNFVLADSFSGFSYSIVRMVGYGLENVAGIGLTFEDPSNSEIEDTTSTPAINTDYGNPGSSIPAVGLAIKRTNRKWLKVSSSGTVIGQIFISRLQNAVACKVIIFLTIEMKI